MIRYIVKRILVAIPMLLGISLLTFILLKVTPGNYLDTLRLDPLISKKTIDYYTELYQLDKPAWQQYLAGLSN